MLPLNAEDAFVEQERTLRADVANVEAVHHHILQRVMAPFDSTRVLGVVCATKGSEHYLPYTVPVWMNQLSRAGKQVDIIIGLNDGYECADVIVGLAALPNTTVYHLATGDKVSGNIPASVFAHDRPSDRYCIPQEHVGHRVFVLHQRSGPYAAGKTRMLQDICDSMVLGSIEQGWVPPKYLAMFDHETVLVEKSPEDDIRPYFARVSDLLQQMSNPQQVVQRLIAEHASSDRSRIGKRAPAPPTINLDAPGLEHLVALLDASAADVVGIGWRNCVYDVETMYAGMPVLMPNLAAGVSVLHEAGHAALGLTPQTMTFSAGCTVGKLDVLLGIHVAMYRTYPGLVGEDAMSTVLAFHAGYNVVFHHGIYNTNRCPSLKDVSASSAMAAWKEQYARWLAVIDTVERLYGGANCTPIRGLDTRSNMTLALALFAKTLRQTNDVPRSFDLLQRFQACEAELDEIRQLARTKAYVMTENHPFTTW